jgi:hypothetical protein
MFPIRDRSHLEQRTLRPLDDESTKVLPKTNSSSQITCKYRHKFDQTHKVEQPRKKQYSKIPRMPPRTLCRLKMWALASHLRPREHHELGRGWGGHGWGLLWPWNVGGGRDNGSGSGDKRAMELQRHELHLGPEPTHVSLMVCAGGRQSSLNRSGGNNVDASVGQTHTSFVRRIKGADTNVGWS